MNASKFHVKYTRRWAYASAHLLTLFVCAYVRSSSCLDTKTLDFCQRNCSCIMRLMNGCGNYVALCFAYWPLDKQDTSMRRDNSNKSSLKELNWQPVWAHCTSFSLSFSRYPQLLPQRLCSCFMFALASCRMPHNRKWLRLQRLLSLLDNCVNEHFDQVFFLYFFLLPQILCAIKVCWNLWTYGSAAVKVAATWLSHKFRLAFNARKLAACFSCKSVQ